MSVFQTIKSQQLTARKNRDVITSNLLTVIIGEFQRGTSKEDPTDDQVFKALEKFAANIRDLVKLTGATDQTTQELNVLNGLIALKPKAATPEEVTAFVKAVIAELPTANMGVVMGKLKQQFGSTLDGKAANQIVKSILTR